MLLNQKTKNSLFLFLFLYLSLLSIGCNEIPRSYNYTSKKYLVGFSQCNTDDLWRQKMINEMKQEASAYPEISLMIKDGENNNQKQAEDIEELIKLKVDVLIVSPNEAEPITPIVEKAYDMGIPVILIDRKINSKKYSVFIGADNYKIGAEAGKYAANLLKGSGRILEITGLKGSSPTVERHNGFTESVQHFKKIQVVKSYEGRWFGAFAEKGVKDAFEENIEFDLVYAHNDVMALGAYNIIKQQKGKKDKYIIGIDALPGANGGIQMVIDKTLDASLLYPTGGDVAIQAAADILNGKHFNREIKLETVLVDSSNARVLKMQADQMVKQQEKIEKQGEILKEQSSEIEAHQVRLYISMVIISIIMVIIILLFRSYRIIKKINFKLEESNEAISRQKEEISIQRDQILEMSNKLKEVNEHKIEFFTNISHEFRTPLTLIITNLHKILTDKPDMGKLPHRLNAIKKNAERMHYLINQLLDFRKLDEQRMHLHAEKHNIITFIKNIIDVFDVLADQNKIKLTFDYIPETIDVWFDEEKLDKIIFNLLANAFKFTPERGSIMVTCKIVQESEDTGLAEIVIADSGIGIPEEELSRIFEPFYEIKREGRMLNAGTGIGLALSKNLIELHHGTLHIKSSKEQGTTLIISLPLGENHLTPEEKNISGNATEIYHNTEEVIDLFTEDIIGKNSMKISAYVTDADKPTLLLVEDNIELVNELRESFSDVYNFKYAEDGESGLKTALHIIPDIIISDIMMPGMDGISMCRVLKNDIRTSHIPVLLLSAKSNEDNLIEGFNTGADDYITKPFNPKLLSTRINNLVNSRKALKKLYSLNITGITKDNTIKDVDKTFLEKVISIIEKNILNPALSVEKLGEEIGLTRVHLYRKIKALTGYTVSEFIRNIKLNKAVELMKNSELTVSEIAFRIGFDTPSYFTKCFKEVYNMTPSEYLLKKNG